VLHKDIDEYRGLAEFRPNQDIRLMSGKLAINKALLRYLDRLQVKNPYYSIRQGFAYKITSVLVLRKNRFFPTKLMTPGLEKLPILAVVRHRIKAEIKLSGSKG